MTNPVGTTAEVLYRFFCGYEGFGDGVPLGFEAVSPGDGAVFSVEPSLVYRTKYINGGGMVRGVCSVTLPARDNDRAARVRASAFLASLSDYAAARQTAAQALAAMKDELGIQSPSRVMRDEVGMQIGYGLAQGMQRSIPKVTEAANQLSAAAVGTNTEQTVYGASRFLRGTAAGFGNGPGGQLQSLTLQVQNHLSTVGEQNSAKHSDRRVGSTTIVFTKPVQTPYAHAKAVRETMEELLYGGV